jgi:hypothetical protein
MEILNSNYYIADFYACKRWKITLKKRHLSINKWEEFKQKLENIPEESRVYIDESGMNKVLSKFIELALNYKFLLLNWSEVQAAYVCFDNDQRVF